MGDLSSLFGVKQRGDISQSISGLQDRIAREISEGNERLIRLEAQKNRQLEQRIQKEEADHQTRLGARKALVRMGKEVSKIEYDGQFDLFFQLANWGFELDRIESGGNLETIDDYSALQNLKEEINEFAGQNFPDIENVTDTAYNIANHVNEILGSLSKSFNNRRYFDPTDEPHLKPLLAGLQEAKDEKQELLYTSILLDRGYYDDGDKDDGRDFEQVVSDAVSREQIADEVIEINESRINEYILQRANHDMEYFDSSSELKSFFDGEDLLDEGLSFKSKIDNEIRELESELGLIEAEADDLVKGQDSLPECFMDFLEATEIEPQFAFEDNVLLFNLLQRGSFGYETLIARLKTIQSFVLESSIDDTLDEFRKLILNWKFTLASNLLSDIEERFYGLCNLDTLPESLLEAHDSVCKVRYTIEALKEIQPSAIDRVFKGKVQAKIYGHVDIIEELSESFPISILKNSFRDFSRSALQECKSNLEGFKFYGAK